MSENMVTSDVSVYAKSIHSSKSKPGSPKSVKFVITKVIRRDDSAPLEEIIAGQEILVATDLSFDSGQQFLIFGTLEFQLGWQSPVMVTQKAIDYLDRMSLLPADGPKRIETAYRYLENPDTLIADDAYNEFAKASYESVLKIKNHYKRKQLLNWIEDSAVSNSRKRLYFTLLGICGTQEEIPFLKNLILNRKKNSVIGLDAIIACYLTLSGKAGLKLVDQEFLRNSETEYSELFAAIAALRFHASEGKRIPKSDVVRSVRLLLKRPKFADLIIPDLARWEDWESAETMVKLFHQPNGSSKWIRQSIVQFLLACPKEIGESHLTALRKSHPDLVKTAKRLYVLKSQMEAESGEDDFDSRLDAIQRARRQSRMKKDSSEEDQSDEILESEEEVFGGSEKGKKGNSEKAKKKSSDTTRVSVQRPVIPNQATPTAGRGSGLNESSTPPTADLPVAKSVNPRLASKSPELNTGNPSVKNQGQGIRYRWWMIGGPIAANLVLFILAWSILSGSFHRLFL